MKLNFLLILAFLLAITTMPRDFKTEGGCGCRRVFGANQMETDVYSFTIITGIVVSNVNPPDGATNISVNTPITFDVIHPLGVASILAVEVQADGIDVPLASINTVPITNGFSVTVTPQNDYPFDAVITWKARVELTQ